MSRTQAAAVAATPLCNLVWRWSLTLKSRLHEPNPKVPESVAASGVEGVNVSQFLLDPKIGLVVTNPNGFVDNLSPCKSKNSCLGMLLSLELTYTLPTPAGAGHQWIESTSTGCNQWLSLAKIALKVPRTGRNRSLVARTSECGKCIRATSNTWLKAHDHCNLRVLIGGEGGDRLSSLHTWRWRPKVQRRFHGWKVYMESYMADYG